MTKFMPLFLVVLCTLKVTLGAPTLTYIVATDPCNNQPYIPLLRTASNIFRNSIWDYTGIFSEPSTVSPGYSSQQPNYLGNQVKQATHLISDGVHGVTKTAVDVGNALFPKMNGLQNTKDMIFPPNHAPANAPHPINVQLPDGGSTVFNVPSTVALPTPASLSPSAVQTAMATPMNLASTNPDLTAANVPVIGAASVAAPKTVPENQVESPQPLAVTAPVTISNPPNPPATLTITNSTTVSAHPPSTRVPAVATVTTT